MNKKKICIVTGTRAEYDLFYHVIKKINHSQSMILQIIVVGSHLSKQHGNTYKEIIKDGFKINKKINILKRKDSTLSMIHSFSNASKEIANSFVKLNPDIILLIGDRYEALAAAISASFLKIPICHIGGGENTFGAIDESIRHSITKFSWWHCVSHKVYYDRVLQMGENPKNVFITGGLGAENINKIVRIKKEDLIKKLKIKFSKNNILFTYHPVTLQKKNIIKDVKVILNFFDTLENTSIIITAPNADADYKIIKQLIMKHIKLKKQYFYFNSLGRDKYLNLLRFMDAVVGNSSSGILEAPSFKIGTINIGNRQEGRIQAKSVINCQPTYLSLKKAFKLLYSNFFLNSLKEIKNPYKITNTHLKIYNLLNKFKLPRQTIKMFHDR